MSLKQKIASFLPPKVVLRVKYIYQYVWRLKSGRKKIETNLEYCSLSKPNTHVFFGYYDVSPFNIKTDEIIYLSLRKGQKDIYIYINKTDLYSESLITTSKAWNWQQGCRLRWMPNSSREIVFNDFDDGRYLSRIINVETKLERHISYPLYDISPDGKYGLSIDFERLGIKRPGYGYTNRPYNEPCHNLAEDSIDLIDLTENKKEVLITYQEIGRIKGCETTDFRNNYLNHLCFSPSGKKFLFFWLTIEQHRHKAYLLVYDLENRQTSLLENQERVSHYVWEDENHIICTAIDDIKKEQHYYRYTINTKERELLNPLVLNRDGHPSLFRNHQILTDTYPDLSGFQHLYLAGTEDSSYVPLLDIYSNCMISGEKRTDLHPRLNQTKNLICFDANISQYRELFFIKINKEE